MERLIVGEGNALLEVGDAADRTEIVIAAEAGLRGAANQAQELTALHFGRAAPIETTAAQPCIAAQQWGGVKH